MGSVAREKAGVFGEKDVRTEYKEKLQQLDEELAQTRALQGRSVMLIAGCALFFSALFFAGLGRNTRLMGCGVVPLACALVASRQWVVLRVQSLRSARQRGFYERGIGRLEGSWQGSGATGREFARKGHLYQDDLNIFGKGSLFELLCTTRSQAGAERLASYLLDAATLEESRARQEAVKELQGAGDLREQIALAGEYEFQRCDGSAVSAWLAMPILCVSRMLPACLLLSGGVCAGLIVCGIAGWAGWSNFELCLLPVLVLHAVIGAVWTTRVRSRLKVLSSLTSEFVVLRQGLELMQQQTFQSAKLAALVDCVQKSNAAAKIRRLELLMHALERREQVPFYLLSLMVAAGTQLVWAIERWRAVNQSILPCWFDAWAEFEALNALACYAYEHPRHTFPEFVANEVVFETTNLGHPLLAEEIRVGNDVLLGEASRFYLISGSNMAGKSTLLRAMGVNAVLALAGTAVCADKMRLSGFAVCVSIAAADSLSEGKSKFLAEIHRLRETIACADGERPVFFLIDEVLSGTNSLDRKIATESVIRALARRRAVGAFSTHDLALTEIANIPEFRGRNVHMERASLYDPLDFDYQLKPGVAKRSNALAIARMMGVAD